MKQFASIQKIDTGILYVLELAASISVLLLAFGLIASMANVLTQGSVLTDSLFMQRLWAWTQCIAIDASVAGTIIRTFRFYYEGETIKAWLYGLLSVLLLFTAAIVSNIEAVQQTLNVTLDNAHLHVFVPVEALIWIRSIAIVLLIVAHAMRHVQIEKRVDQPAPLPAQVTPELLRELQTQLSQTTVSETTAPETPQLPETATATQDSEGEGETVRIVLLGVADADVARVLQAYKQGVRRREMCAYLHWGSSKYTTIVKPVLDAYEQQATTGK
jgi:hypothetical protein